MKLTKIALMTAAVLTNVAHAGFKANFPSIPVKVVSKDGKPLKDIHISYNVRADKTQICRGDSPIDFGRPCKGDLEVKNSQAYVVTNENGVAVIPAIKASDSSLSGRNPKIIISVAGYTVPFTIESGKTLSCMYPIGLGVANFGNLDVVDLDEQAAKEYSEGKIVFKTYYDKDNMIQFYQEDGKAVMKREYSEIYENPAGPYKQFYLNDHNCK